MARLEVGLAEGEGVFAPHFFQTIHFVDLLMLEKESLGQEVVGPVLITTTQAHLRQQTQCSDVSGLKLTFVKAPVDEECECFGVEREGGLLAGAFGYRLKEVTTVNVVETRVGQLELDFLSALVDEVVDLLCLEQVADG